MYEISNLQLCSFFSVALFNLLGESLIEFLDFAYNLFDVLFLFLPDKHECHFEIVSLWQT